MFTRLAFAFAATLLPAICLGAENPHEWLNQRENCLKCHVEPSGETGTEDSERFVKDIVALCLDCHGDKDSSDLHPVDIRPQMEVPQALPLDRAQTITCATCHDPHMDHEADSPVVAEPLARRLLALWPPGKKHRSLFLRLPNEEGQLCLSCHDGDKLGARGFHIEEASVLDSYVGSARCGKCHDEAYRQWQMTPHARMVRDPAKDPSAILGDFTLASPFDRSTVRYALGSHWTQRYVVEKSGEMVVKAPIWSITGRVWDTSYWSEKRWAQNCQGCHTTGFEMRNEPRFSEPGIGCEACHGPGRQHTESGGESYIVNPAKLGEGRREMICQACHTTGHDRTGQFRFPLGYLPGRDLSLYFRGLMPKPGQDNSSFTGDGSAEDRSRQFRFWRERYMIARGVTCDTCKNFRMRANHDGEKEEMTVSEHCLTCHESDFDGIEQHETAEVTQQHICDDCHAPTRARGVGYSVHDHKFRFGPGGE